MSERKIIFILILSRDTISFFFSLSLSLSIYLSNYLSLTHTKLTKHTQHLYTYTRTSIFLQVVLAAGILTHLTVAGPLFGEYNYDDYYDDYNEDPIPVEETPVAEAEPNIDPEYDYNYNEDSLYNDGNDPVETAVDSGFGDSEWQPDYGDNYDYYNVDDNGDASQAMVLSDKDNDNHHHHHGSSSSDHEGSADFDSLENVVSGDTKDFMPVATHGLVPITKIPSKYNEYICYVSIYIIGIN